VCRCEYVCEDNPSSCTIMWKHLECRYCFKHLVSSMVSIWSN
jgi:hypothetical protein